MKYRYQLALLSTAGHCQNNVYTLKERRTDSVGTQLHRARSVTSFDSDARPPVLYAPLAESAVTVSSD